MELSERERKRARAALAKRGQGLPLSREDERAIERVERAHREAIAAEAYRAVPKKLWREWSGRQTKILNEQAERYGLPLGEATIDLAKLAPALHDFLAANATRLAAEDASGEASPALERKRLADAQMRELDLAVRRGELVELDDIHHFLSDVAALFRSAGERLGRQVSGDAQAIVEEALVAFQRRLRRGEWRGAQPDEEATT